MYKASRSEPPAQRVYGTGVQINKQKREKQVATRAPHSHAASTLGVAKESFKCSIPLNNS